MHHHGLNYNDQLFYTFHLQNNCTIYILYHVYIHISFQFCIYLYNNIHILFLLLYLLLFLVFLFLIHFLFFFSFLDYFILKKNQLLYLYLFSFLSLLSSSGKPCSLFLCFSSSFFFIFSSVG